MITGTDKKMKLSILPGYWKTIAKLGNSKHQNIRVGSWNFEVTTRESSRLSTILQSS